MLRLASLLLGPLVIVGFAYLVARPDFDRALPAPANTLEAETVSESPAAASPSGSDNASQVRGVPDARLLGQCQQTREALMRRLGVRFT
jgi:hypothetical protein